MTTIPQPAVDDPCLRVAAEVRFGEISEPNRLIDPTGWAAITALIVADEWEGGALTEQVPILADDWLAQWATWNELAADPAMANAALKTAVAAAVAAGQECRDWMRASRALIHLLKTNGSTE